MNPLDTRSSMRSGQLLVSVVIPTYNRPRQLRDCLEALSLQDFPADAFEVIVVDDGGAITLDEVLAPFRQRLEIGLLHQVHRGCASARQLGIDHAAGEYLAFTDDDCCPSPDWLSRMAAVLKANPGCAAGGSTVNGAIDDPFAEATQTIVRVLTEWPQDNAGLIPYCPTSNAMFPAAAFRLIGGLDSNWNIAGGEDRDLCARWRKSGRPLVYRPDARVYHFHRLTVLAFLKQHFHYGRGAARFLRLGEAGESKVTACWGFYAALFRAPFVCRPSRRASLVAGLILLAQVATAGGMIAQTFAPATRRTQERLAARS